MQIKWQLFLKNVSETNSYFVKYSIKKIFFLKFLKKLL